MIIRHTDYILLFINCVYFFVCVSSEIILLLRTSKEKFEREKNEQLGERFSALNTTSEFC